MIESITSSLRKYFDFKGRATRKEFWTFYAFYLFTIMFGGVIDGFVGTTDTFSGTALFIFIIPTYACVSRRIHDTGKSAWFIFVPFYNLVLLLSPSAPSN